MPIAIGSGKALPDEIRRRAKNELFQRFLFLVVKPIINASFNGFIRDGLVVYPIIGIFVADEPQERYFMRLKYAESFADCTCFLMPSIVDCDSLVPAAVIKI